MPGIDLGYSLVHPVYLDVPMMVSFLAHLEGGVTTQEEETKRNSGARERALKGRAGLRLRWPALVEADLGSEGSTQRRDETAVESKTERHHTAASLFNLLYDYLREDEQLVELHGADALDQLHSGQLVEVAGEYLGNPLEDTLALFGSLLPYLAEQQETQKAAAEAALASTRKSQRSGNPKRDDSATIAAAALEGVLQQSHDAETAFGMRMLARMVADIASVPVHDLLLRTAEGLQVVLTVSSEFYSATTNEYLKAGEFRVVGKVTRVVTGDRTINLTRRTVLGAAGAEVAKDIIDSVKGTDLSLDVADPIVAAPAVQILPMAIFL